jgi:hypothetical protein
MSKEQDKELDDLFKKKLEDPADETGFREEDWNDLENLLEKRKTRRPIVYLLPIISSIAALFLLFFGLPLFQPKVSHNSSQNKFQAANIHRKTNVYPKINNAKISIGKEALINKQTTPANTYYAVKGKRNRPINDNSLIPALTSTVKQADTNNQVDIANTENAVNNTKYIETLVAISYRPQISDEEIAAQQINSTDIPKSATNASTASSNNKTRAQSAFRPQYALSVLAAPDINGAGTFQQSKVGTNVGLLFSAGFYKKFTVSTGALYSAKPYSAGYESYNLPGSFKINPLSITADCRMLDIPLNIGYQVYHKKQNKLTIGTGLSSYIMLHEAYTFNYVTSTSAWSSNFTVPNSNKYFFGVYNLNATYERQLNAKVGLTVQPYLKLPLTAIGYSQVRLQTTGVAVGLNWNLNSSNP